MASSKLSKSMSPAQFRNGYWYASELRAFASKLGFKSISRLRKDELEDVIIAFLETGEVRESIRKTPASAATRDAEQGLSPDLRVIHYKNDTETWQFIETEAGRMDPDYRRKSGARYRLNRWREEQMRQGTITYADLVKQYVELSRHEGPFEQARSGRYINFLSDYLRTEPEATREDAIRAWHQLKTLDIPKDYESWRRHVQRSPVTSRNKTRRLD